jgi:hypothetical protein
MPARKRSGFARGTHRTTATPTTPTTTTLLLICPARAAAAAAVIIIEQGVDELVQTHALQHVSELVTHAKCDGVDFHQIAHARHQMTHVSTHPTLLQVQVTEPAIQHNRERWR